MFFILWHWACYIDWWADHVTFSMALERCFFYLTVVLLRWLMNRLRLLVPGLRTVLFAIRLSFCYAGWWIDSVFWSLVFEPFCLLSDCHSVTLVDEQTPSPVSWSYNHVVCCPTVVLLLWLMNSLRHLFRDLITTLFSVWQSPCYTDWLADSVIGSCF